MLNEGKKRAIFLSVIGAKNYAILRGLAENRPEQKTFEELCILMERHIRPAPNEIHERFLFNTRDKQEGESISEYVATLRKMSEHCNFEEKVNEHIRDRLVVGVKDEKIQERLLGERMLTLHKAIEIAVSMESARKYSKLMLGAQTSGSETSVHRLPLKRECYRCGSTGHQADKCQFKNKECFKCRRIGHTRRKCRQEESRPPSSATRGKESRMVNNVEENCCEEMEISMERLDLHTVANLRTPPVLVELLINQEKVVMEVDTGAACTVMSLEKFNKIGQVRDLKESHVKLRTYTGELVKPHGTTDVEVIQEGLKHRLPLLVVKGNVPTLLGRNWLNKVKLDWRSMFPLYQEDSPSRLERLLKEFDSLFSEEMGCLKDFKVKIPIDKTVSPKFCRARPVPYAIKADVEKELDRLENQGIYKRVEYSRWAAPIVPVAKNNNEGIRICGDYKQTVNRASPCDYYPLPRTEDIFATLKGGQKFSKLDLSHAYQQLELDAETQELLTVNTHQGLYQPTRLQFGVHSATGIFQREMDKRLKNIPFCKVRVDDILVSGSDDSSHLKNLYSVFAALDKAGLKLKRSKCKFLLPEVTYLGFRISKEGIASLPDKVQTEAPRPQNITELRAYLRALNYYHSHLPNLSTILEPLHNLMRKGAP